VGLKNFEEEKRKHGTFMPLESHHDASYEDKVSE
jgi:hypothetical protein